MPRRHRSKRGSRYYLQGPIAPNLSTRNAVRQLRRVEATGQRRGELPDAMPGTARFRLTNVCGVCFYFQEAEEAAPTVAELADHAK
jgi:hypothetical protein